MAVKKTSFPSVLVWSSVLQKRLTAKFWTPIGLCCVNCTRFGQLIHTGPLQPCYATENVDGWKSIKFGNDGSLLRPFAEGRSDGGEVAEQICDAGVRRRCRLCQVPEKCIVRQEADRRQGLLNDFGIWSWCVRQLFGDIIILIINILTWPELC